MAAAALSARPAGRRPAAGARAPRAGRAWAPSPRSGSSPALHWGALIRPAQGGDMLLSLLFALAGGGRAHRAPGRRWPDVAAAHRRRRRGLRAARPGPARRRRAAAHARLAQVGRPRVGHVAGHQLDAGHHGALPRHRRVGAHRDPLGRDRAAGARRAAGLLAAARRDARLPDRGGGRAGHALRRPDHRARARLALLRRRDVLHPARRLPVARARPLRPARRRRDLRGGHRDRRGDHRAAPGQHAAVVQLRGLRREARAQRRPRRSRGRTATGR